MKKLLLILSVLVPVSALGATILTVDDSGNVVASGSLSGTTFSFSGDLTLANGATLDEATADEVRFTYGADAATLGELILESDNAQGNMSDGDSFILRAKANDDFGDKTTFALIDMEASDVTNGSEDGVIRLQIQDGGSLIDVATFGSLGIDLENGERLDNTSDRFLTISFDDDAADLGTLKLTSENAVEFMNDSDHLDLVFEAKDSGGDATEYATIEGTADDITAGTEDGSVVLKAMADGSETIVATFGGTAITLSKATTASSTLAVTGDLTANGNIVGDGSTAITNATVWVDTAGYWDILDATQLVFVVSGTMTNVIDADINN